MSSHDYIKPILEVIQPYYDELNSRFSSSYLSGSSWYVGNNLVEWWTNCNNIRHFEENKKKVGVIIEILRLDHKDR